MNRPRTIARLPLIILTIVISIVVLVAVIALTMPYWDPYVNPMRYITPSPTPGLSVTAEPSNWKYQTGKSRDGAFFVAATISSTRHSSEVADAAESAELLVICFPDSQQANVEIDFKAEVSEGSDVLSVAYTFEDQLTVARTWLMGTSNSSALAPDAVKTSFAKWAMESHTLWVTAESWANSETELFFKLRGKSNPWHPVRLVLSACGRV